MSTAIDGQYAVSAKRPDPTPDREWQDPYLTIAFRLAVASIAIDATTRILTGIILARSTPGLALVSLGLVGAYIGLAPAVVLTFAHLLRHRLHVHPALATSFKFSLLAAVYFATWMALGVALGQHPKDVVGSTGRVLLPFLAILVIIATSGTASGLARRLTKSWFKILVWATLAEAAVKLALLATGSTYGGGLNQFSLGVPLFIYLAIRLSDRRHWASSARRLCVLLGLLVLVGLSILSLKRGIWLELGIAALLATRAIHVRRYVRWIVSVAAVVAVLAGLFSVLDASDDLESRIDYTFSGQGQGIGSLDSSSYVRFAEMEGAASTLARTKSFVPWLVGVGPGAGYDQPSSIQLKNINERGEPYHIHAALGITVFRYGLIGLLFHFGIIGHAWSMNRDFAREVRSERYSARHLVGFVTSAGVVALIATLFTSNGFFGNFELGVLYSLALLAKCLPWQSANGPREGI